MIWRYCKRGVVAGAVAGVVYGVFVALVANPLIEYVREVALGLEHAGHASVVSETTTATVSVGSGVLWGIFLGVVFAVAYYFLEPVLPGPKRVKPYVLAGAGFLTVSVTPWLVVPPGAPGAEQTLGMRTQMIVYASLMVAGAALAAVSIGAYRHLRTRRRDVAALAGLAPVLAAVLVVPQVTPTFVSAGEVPATLFTAFQGLVGLSQAALWLVLAVGYDRLSGRNTGKTHTTVGETAGVTEP